MSEPMKKTEKMSVERLILIGFGVTLAALMLIGGTAWNIAMPFTPGPIDAFNQSEGSPKMYEPYLPLTSFNAGPLYHGAPLSG